MESEKYIKELSGILKREIRSFTTILELLILEEKSLVDCNTKALSEVLERQEDLFSSIACLEKSRIDVLRKIAEYSGTDSETLTLAHLIDSTDGSLRHDLEESRHILGRLYEEIQNKKVTNSHLINQSILLVESDIRLIINSVHNLDTRKTVYQSHSETQGKVRSVCINEII